MKTLLLTLDGGFGGSYYVPPQSRKQADEVVSPKVNAVAQPQIHRQSSSETRKIPEYLIYDSDEETDESDEETDEADLSPGWDSRVENQIAVTHCVAEKTIPKPPPPKGCCLIL